MLMLDQMTAFAASNTLTASDPQTLSPETQKLGFSVASIRPDPKPTYMRLEFTVDGFRAHGVTFRQLIQMAYGIFEYDCLIGEEQWVDIDYFDVEAKIDDSHATDLRNLPLDQRRAMLQALLKDRFTLAVHRENIERPVYEMIVAKGGQKLKDAKPDDILQSPIRGHSGWITRSNRGILEVKGFSMDDLAAHLSDQWVVDRHVINRTGLTGYYNFSLHWIPDDLQREMRPQPDSQQSLIPHDPGSSSTIFTEIQKQLGLKLRPSKGPVEVIVFDRASQPTPN